MTVSTLLERHPAAWRAATRHPFLDAVREGTLPTGAFTAWLIQDYLFVMDLLGFQARLLARAPRPAQAVLAAGLVAVEAELGWFEAQAQGWGVAVMGSRHPATAAYRDFLMGLEREASPTAITTLWALERAYLDAWRSAAPGDPQYRAFVEHWTAPSFAAYVGDLERTADRALAGGAADQAAEGAFLEVARLERDFWQMAWSGETR
jgi:thiaminase/transcriptional activator TenA